MTLHSKGSFCHQRRERETEKESRAEVKRDGGGVEGTVKEMEDKDADRDGDSERVAARLGQVH